jgi:hypothetical protein
LKYVINLYSLELGERRIVIQDRGA